MVLSECDTYEKIYFRLWELSQRYGEFAEFRVIGSSHDERMIPMLEIGHGDDCVFCLSGLDGTDRQMPGCLIILAEEYCQAYECGWMMRDFYDVRKLLSSVRLCMIPLLNPDGYEICRNGYQAIRNPIFRQMLRMQDMPYEEFAYNARGMFLMQNFPTSYCMRSRIHQEPASENETKSVIRIFQEYHSRGLLSFCHSGRKIIYYRQPQAFSYNQRAYRLARHLQKCSSYRLEKSILSEQENGHRRGSGCGSPEQYYAEICKQPALRIETPERTQEKEDAEEGIRKNYEEIHTLPLEYIFSLE